MSKKNKKKRSKGVTYESQQELLRKQNELFLKATRGEAISPELAGVSTDDIAPPSDNLFKTVEDVLPELIKGRGQRQPREDNDEPFMVPRDDNGNPIDVSSLKMDVSDIIQSDKETPDREMIEFNKKLAQMMEEDEQEEEEVVEEVPKIHQSMNRIQFSHHETDAYNIVQLFDGVRAFTIDANTLPQDTFALPNTDTMNPLMIASVRLEEILPFMYPGMIMSRARLSSIFRHLKEFDEEKFKFFEYPDGNNNLVVGYYISEENMREFIEDAALMADKGCLVSFLNALYDISSTPGIAFSNVSVGFIKQIMLTKTMEESTKVFLQVMMDDDETVFDDEQFNDTIDEVVQILPYNYMATDIDMILSPEEEEEEDMSDYIPDPEPDDDEEDEVEEEVVETSEKADSGSSLFDDVEGAEEEVEDPEQAEKEYYSQKGKKPPQQQPRQKKKPDDDDDSKWKLKRR